ncbi:hypothetical protein [Propionivibrio soli]|uniref:hypothetical protein n=1 Tax=Propionivibrio soli TaxID=2976531 RepID=UPI0021E7F64F|nr:hypothetical protein [Propionivibrio soli]
MKRLPGLVFALLLPGAVVSAQESVDVCFNYSCLTTASVTFSAGQLSEIRTFLGTAQTPAEERALIGIAIGRLLGWAGKVSPIGADKGGNIADDGVYGRMDCIDHSTTTTRLLNLLERNAMLRWHRVREPVVRTRFLIFDHWTAVIEEIDGVAPRKVSMGDPMAGVRYAVDSWFNDNGQPAVVLPLDKWLSWGKPDA